MLIDTFHVSIIALNVTMAPNGILFGGMHPSVSLRFLIIFKLLVNVINAPLINTYIRRTNLAPL